MQSNNEITIGEPLMLKDGSLVYIVGEALFTIYGHKAYVVEMFTSDKHVTCTSREIKQMRARLQTYMHQSVMSEGYKK